MFHFLDLLFHLLHLIVITINLTFWLSLRTLRWAQFIQIATFLNWFGLGVIYGFGYCFLTDWHWEIKEKLGEKDLPASYIKYILDRATGSDWDPVLVDQMTMAFFAFAAFGCVFQSLRKRKISAQ